MIKVKIKNIIFAILIITIFISLISLSYKNNISNDKKDDYIVNNDEIVQSIIDKKMQKMTLKEKIGQMIFIGENKYGPSLNDELLSILTYVKPGGFVIFKNNISSYTGLKELMHSINLTTDIPLIWSIDQEGGSVQRLTEENVGATNIPYMYYLGKTEDTNLAYNVGKVIAEELRVFGFNMDFAPVIDVWSNKDNKVIGKRAFGKTIDTVVKMSSSFAKGLEDSGVIPVYKHFPGHGDTLDDSHYSLPIISKTKEELLSLEIVPFKKAIENGAKVIMIGHLSVPALTNSNIVPASLSKEVITNFLKEELGFNGIVITDALDMKALNTYTKKELYVNAINAGVDILLMPEDPKEALDIIYDAVINGEISEDAINNSVKKILKLKTELPLNVLDESYLGSDSHKEIVGKISIE